MGKNYHGQGIYVKFPRKDLGKIDDLVARGDYLNRTHLVRRAVEELLKREHPQEEG